MNENHQDKTGNKQVESEVKLWLPPLSPEDHKKLNRLRSKGKRSASGWTGFTYRTLWDWLQFFGVLAIPIVVAAGTLYLTQQQVQLSVSASNQQHQTDIQIAQDQQHATILQTYIDNIQDLLLNHNLLGDSPKPKNDADKVTIQEVQELARARTLTALQGLDPHRKGTLVQFLYEAKLIGYQDSKGKQQDPIITLSGADLTHTDLAHISLTGANLRGITLTYAFLDSANLSGANFSGANLNNDTFISADLTGANLTDANLTDTMLTSATLAGAFLTGATLTGATLTNATLWGTTLDRADLSGAYFTQEQLNQTYSCLGTILLTGLKCPQHYLPKTP
jgi:uncharacterized protein YjbI with pentapeptide repeats